MRTALAKFRAIFITSPCGVAALCLSVSLCFGQRYSFRTTSAGLGDLNINCIAQDRTGYLWVGTENGLFRYDGVQFRQYGAAEGIHGRTVQDIFLGLDGTLWVGTTHSLYFQRHDGTFAEVRPPGPVTEFSQRIGTVFTAKQQDQVVMADRSGAYLLRRMEPERWEAEPMPLDGKAIWSVLYGPAGELWYGCDQDLCKFESGRTTHLREALKLPEDRWLHPLLTHDRHLWLRGLSHLGELVLSESRYAARDFPGHTIPVPYFALAIDGQGRVAATQGSEFGLWEHGQWRMTTAANGLSKFDISALFVDREGSMWFGVVGHGLTRWLGQGRWESFTVDNGLSDDVVWASLRDRDGRLWIGTESGLDYVAAGSNAPKAWQSPGIVTARADSLAESADGSIWLGSAAGSLVRIDERTLAGKQWKVPEVYRIVADGAGRLWIATTGGLYVADTGGAKPTPRRVEDAALPRQRFTDLCMDSEHHLWGASDGGLFRLSGKTWSRIDPGLAGVNPFLIAADGAGNLWVTGSFPGVMRLHIAGDRVMDAAHITQPPLLSEQVDSLAVDSRGWLWLGQDAGVSAFDGHTWRSFTQDDGLVWNDTDGNALMEDTDGSMWIGTSGGISHLMTPQRTVIGVPPAPIFSDALFGATPIANGSKAPWDPSPFDVSMASLSFRDDRHIRFRYRLVGLESEWIDTAEKSVRYARLEPGAYRFQAMAVDADSGAVSPMEEISFRITKRWWQSGLVNLSFALFCAVGVVLLVRLRVRRLVGQKRQLELAVLRRTEDLEREKAELLHARDQMRHFAEHDDLTGLWNHRIIIERLRQEIDRSRREGSPISVILVDLDHFKNINDTFGHPAGDIVLREVGAIFLRSLRSYDSVGRYGGEEFLLILPGTAFSDARNRAEQLRGAVQAARILNGVALIPVTASFGVAAGFPAGYESMIQAADTALYRAKDKGRNCVEATETFPPDGFAGTKK